MPQHGKDIEMLRLTWVEVPEHQYISQLTMEKTGLKLKMGYQIQILEKLGWLSLHLIVQFFMLP